MTKPVVVDVVIVGAGFAGLYQLYRLRELGFRCRVVEVAEEVGGTWYWNRYPGARCDIESMAYCYSFSRELEQEWNWTEKFPTQPEILSYINHVADRFDLRKDITFGTRVQSMVYEEGAQRWRVETDTGESIDTQFVIAATGCLSAPKEPEFPGQHRFRGPIYNTSNWPHTGVDFTGLKVGVVGTGSSGIQCIPLIAEQAAELTVFQRTPNFSQPAANRLLVSGETDERKRTYAEFRIAQRASFFGVPIPEPTSSALDVSAEERTAKFQAAWDQGSLVALMNSYDDILYDESANDVAADFIRQKIRATVTDTEVAETLTPRGYPYGAKRPCLDTGYYQTFNKSHVHLVDLRKTPLSGLTELGIETSSHEYVLDAVVFATGFDAITGALSRIDIRGVGGVTLRDAWSAGASSYLGLTVAGFPNLFTITGPLSPSVFSNVILSIEQHVDWISDCLKFMRANRITGIEANRDAQDAWSAHVAEVGNSTLYPQADSYYLGANVPGKPRVLLAYLGGIAPYREKCDAVAKDGYEGFTLTHQSGAVNP